MRIYVNQAGYLPESKKTVLLAEAAEEGRGGTGSSRHSTETVRVYDRDGKCVLEKETVYRGYDSEADDFVWRADISELTVPGEYRVEYESEADTYHAELRYPGVYMAVCARFSAKRCIFRDAEWSWKSSMPGSLRENAVTRERQYGLRIMKE